MNGFVTIKRVKDYFLWYYAFCLLTLCPTIPILARKFTLFRKLKEHDTFAVQ